MGFFNFLGTTLSGGGESYSKAVSSELANYRERGMQPYDRSIKRDAAIQQRVTTDQLTKNVAANERVIGTTAATATRGPAIAMANTTVPTSFTNFTDPVAQPMATATAPTTPTAAIPEPSARGAKPDFYGSVAGTPTAPREYSPLAERTMQFLFGRIPERSEALQLLNDGIKKIDARLISEAQYTPAGVIPNQKLIAERNQLIKLRDELQPEPRRSFLGKEIGATTPAAAPAAAAPAAAAPAAAAPAAAAPTTPATAINLPSAGPAAGGQTNLVPGPAGSQVTGVPAPQGAWVNKAPVITQYANNIAAAAQVAGVSPEYLVTIAGVESSFDPNADNPLSSGLGLFQFIESTAKQYGLTDPTDPVQAIRAVGEFTRDNRRTLEKELGRPPQDRELYLAHQQGAGSVAKLLNAGNKLAKDIVGTDEVLKNAGTLTMTGPEFAEHVMQMQDKKAASLSMTPVEALQLGAGNIGLDTQPYIKDPNRTSYDIQITQAYQQQQQNTFDMTTNELTYAQENAADLARIMGPMQYREYLNGLRRQQMDVSLAADQGRFTVAMLYAYQGLNYAQGGKTGLLNAALTELTGVQTEIIPRNSQDGTPLFYSLAIAGQPVGDPMPYDQLVQEVRTRTDRGYAESVAAAQAETASTLAIKQIEQRYAIELKQLETYLDTASGITLQKAQAQREILVAQAARGKGLEPVKESTDEDQPIFRDPDTGFFYRYVLQTDEVNGKDVSTPMFERIF